MGVFGWGEKIKLKFMLKLILWISFMVFWKFLLVFFGKLMIKLELIWIFGCVLCSLWMMDLYLIVVCGCFIIVRMWLFLFCIGKCRKFISLGVFLYIVIMLLVNLSGWLVVKWIWLMLLMVVIKCSNLVKE